MNKALSNICQDTLTFDETVQSFHQTDCVQSIFRSFLNLRSPLLPLIQASLWNDVVCGERKGWGIAFRDNTWSEISSTGCYCMVENNAKKLRHEWMKEPTKQTLMHTHTPSNKPEFDKNLTFSDHTTKYILGRCRITDWTEYQHPSWYLCSFSAQQVLAWKPNYLKWNRGQRSRAKIRRGRELNMQELRQPIPVTFRQWWHVG